MLQIVKKWTNVKIRELKTHYQDETVVSQLVDSELNGFIGLLYLAGLYKGAHVNLSEFYAKGGHGVPLFRLIMSENRARLLLRALRFDDRRIREERKENDKLAPIREVYDLFLENCRSNFEPGTFITIDEQLIKFNGRASFKQYMPKKPAKFGIKFYALVDTVSCYLYTIEVYVGKHSREKNTAENVVKRLVSDLPAGIKRKLTMDNYYTSYALATELLEENIELLGTVKKNRAFIPKEIKQVQPAFTTQFGFTDKATLVAYTTKKPRKKVFMLSTMPEFHDKLLTKPDSDQPSQNNLPAVISLYNKTKDGVDNVDRMLGTYSTSRVTCRWPLTIFFHTLSYNVKILHSHPRQ